MLGGTIGPNVPAVVSKPIENRLLYPASTKAGYIIVPMAITVAGLEPDIEPKNKQASTAAAANPPGTQPMIDLASPINRSDNPPMRINSAAKIKKGMDIKEKLFIPENIRMGTTTGLIAPKKYSVAVTANASAAKIGSPNNKRAKKIETNGADIPIIYAALMSEELAFNYLIYFHLWRRSKYNHIIKHATKGG